MLDCRISINNRIRRHIPRHDRACSDQGELADRVAANDCRIGADAGTPLHKRRQIVFAPISWKGGPWCMDVGKDDGRTAENIVFQCHPFINGNIVLHLDIAADRYPRSNHDILTDATALADSSAGKEMAEVPDASPLTNMDPLIDIG